MNLFTISTAELVTLNAIAVQYIRRTDPSCTSDCRTAFNHFWFFAELTVVILVTNRSVRRTDRSTELSWKQQANYTHVSLVLSSLTTGDVPSFQSISNNSDHKILHNLLCISTQCAPSLTRFLWSKIHKKYNYNTTLPILQTKWRSYHSYRSSVVKVDKRLKL